MKFMDWLPLSALRSGFTLLVALASLFFSVGYASAQQFTIEDLGDLGVPSAFAEDINESGDVVGWSYAIGPSGNSEERAFLWLAEAVPDLGLGAGMHNLGTLGGNFSQATGVNDLRQVSGYTGTSFGSPGPTVPPPPPPPGEPVSQGFMWSQGSMKEIQERPAAFPFTFTTRINNQTQVVGLVYEQVDAFPFVWSATPSQGYPSGVSVLDGPLRYGSANGINDAGMIVGSFSGGAGSGVSDAAVWLPQAAHGLPAGPSVLPLAGAELGEARAVNQHGTVVGAALFEGDLQVFLWRQGETTVFFSPPDLAFAYPLDLNDRDQIVGYGERSPTPTALLWRHGELIDLNTAIPPGTGWQLERATAINNRGQIVGHGTLGGFQRAFLLTPIPFFEDGFESGDLGGWNLSVP